MLVFALPPATHGAAACDGRCLLPTMSCDARHGAEKLVAGYSLRSLAVGGGSMCVSSDRELALPSSGVRSGAIEATRVGASLHVG